MNLRQLSYFLQIAELQSFTRAANVLHVAQPSLSRQIQMLEQELGVLLFNRSDKGATLTEAGVTLQDRASTVLQQVRLIPDEVGRLSASPKGALAVGLPPSLFEMVTVPLVAVVRERYPDVRLQVQEGLSASSHELVLTNKLDLAVVSDAEPLGMLRSRDLLREPLYLVGPASAGLDASTDIDVGRLQDHPLILTGRPNAMRVIVERAAAEIGLTLKPVAEANSSRLLAGLVAEGLGWTVLPISAVAEGLALGRLSAAPLRGISVTWTLVSSRNRNLSLAGLKLREEMVALAARQCASGRWPGVVALD